MLGKAIVLDYRSAHFVRPGLFVLLALRLQLDRERTAYREVHDGTHCKRVSARFTAAVPSGDGRVDGLGVVRDAVAFSAVLLDVAVELVA